MCECVRTCELVRGFRYYNLYLKVEASLGFGRGTSGCGCGCGFMHDVAVDRLGNEHCGSVHATAICRLRIRNAGLATKATEERMNGVPRDHM